MEVIQPNIFERFNNWIRESVTVKLVSIGFLILILMIPQSWIQSLIFERQARAQSVIDEIASKWSGRQNVQGPVLIIPYTHHEKIDRGKEGVEIYNTTKQAFFLPEKLNIKGNVKPQILRRGIFESAVYESDLEMLAQFQPPDFDKLNIQSTDVQWKEARLVMGIHDLRGISENPVLKVGGQTLTGEPSDDIGVNPRQADDNNSGENGIAVKLSWKGAEDFVGDVSIHLSLKGSDHLYFAPVGKTTEVSLAGPWADPSFDGEFLPASRDVNAAGFSASWKILHYNRPFAQQWADGRQKIGGSEFGVRLLIPVDQYQKSERTAKYGILIILLTFISLFMVEIMKKVRIHPFQYILIGAALIIYYSLLLSFSEHFGYNGAYGIASIATILLVVLYSSSFLESRKLVFVFGGLLAFFYGFIFVIIQLQDYSLLLGSIGLFAIVGMIMYFSRRIKWYEQ